MGYLHRIFSTSQEKIVRAALVSGGLSFLFIVCYSGSSWITSLRGDVGTLYFSWERAIPLVSILIIPYMSIDLFFVGTPFLYKEWKDILLFAKRITFVIVVSCCFFLIMPLEYAFAREVPDNQLGFVFQFLYSFDRPYNLFPSLHIALRTLLADAYTRHARTKLIRWSLHGWFSLIGFSTVFTHQHHIVDIVGGFIVAICSFYFFQQDEEAYTKNYRVGMLYGLLTLLLIIVSFLTWPLGMFFWWPATSLFILTSAYFGLVQTVYRKQNGKLSSFTQFLHFFPLLGQKLSLVYYKQQASPWNQLLPGLYIGRLLNNSEAEELKQLGITSVLDLTTEFSEPDTLVDLEYMNISVIDLTAPTHGQLDRGVNFIEKGMKNGGVYVHCKIGYSRTVAMAGAYLLATKMTRSVGESIDLIRSARPDVVIRPEVSEALENYISKENQGT